MRFNSFLRGEFKRAAKGFDRDAKKQWREIEKTFELARECVKEYELEQQRQKDACNMIERIKAGGDPYDW